MNACENIFWSAKLRKLILFANMHSLLLANDDKAASFSNTCCMRVSDKIILAAFQAPESLEQFVLLEQPNSFLSEIHGHVSVLELCMACDLLMKHIPSDLASQRAYDIIVDFAKKHWDVLGHADLSDMKWAADKVQTSGLDVGYGSSIVEKQQYVIDAHFKQPQHKPLCEVLADRKAFENVWAQKLIKTLDGFIERRYCQDLHCWELICKHQ
jgi:hypothetical protein